MTFLAKAKIAMVVWAWLWIAAAWFTREWIFFIIGLPPFIALNRYGQFLFPGSSANPDLSRSQSSSNKATPGDGGGSGQS